MKPEFSARGEKFFEIRYGFGPDPSDVIHLSFFRVLVEKLLKRDFIGGFVNAHFEPAPGGAELRCAVRVGQRGSIEYFAVNGPKDVAQGYFGRRAGEEIAAFLAAKAFGDAFGFQFDEDLDEVIGRDVLRSGEILDTEGRFARKMPRQTEHGPHCIVAFNRKLHPGKLAEEAQTAITDEK